MTGFSWMTVTYGFLSHCSQIVTGSSEVSTGLDVQESTFTRLVVDGSSAGAVHMSVYL